MIIYDDDDYKFGSWSLFNKTIKVRNITNSASDQGKIVDEYFSGKYKLFDEAVALTEGFVDEQIQVCEQIYKQ